MTAAAFLLGRGERYLSVEWLEWFHRTDRISQLDGARRILSTKLKMQRTARIAVLSVDHVCEYVARETSHRIEVLHDPEPADPAHCGIFGTAADEPLIAELIAESVIESQPAMP